MNNEIVILILMALMSATLTFKQVGIRMEEKSTEQEIEGNRFQGPMILVNRKMRRFIKRMTKGKLDLRGINEGPTYMIMQVQGLMNRQMKIQDKRIEFAKMMEIGEKS